MINDQVNNPENSENQDHSSYMPSNDQPASPELDLPLGEAVTPPVSPISEHAATPEPSNYGFERQNAELLWVAQKVNDVRNELSK